MNDELKPCPFCGQPAVLDEDGQVTCNNEDCIMWPRFYSLQQWQTRPVEDAFRSENDQLRGAQRHPPSRPPISPLHNTK